MPVAAASYQWGDKHVTIIKSNISSYRDEVTCNYRQDTTQHFLTFSG